MGRKVSVIIPIFNGLRYLDVFFESLRGALPDGAQVIFVDDGSSEPVLTRLPELPAASEVITLRNEHNAGYSVAVNRGFARCSGDYIVQLNTDLVLDPDCVVAMLDLIDREKRVGIVGSKLIFPTTGLIQHIGMAFGQFSRPHIYFQLPADHPLCRETRAMQIVTGATVACSRQVLDRIGPLDERYFNHNEDLDHCLRAVECGLVNYTCSGSIAYHWTSQSGPGRFARTDEADALFWSTWRSKVRVDLGDYVEASLSHLLRTHPHIEFEDFEIVDLCRGGDDVILIECLSRFVSRGAIRVRYHRQTNNPANKYWLAMILPYRMASDPVPFVYLVDQYQTLNENQLWFRNRLGTVKEEVILDTTGCAVTVSEFLGARHDH